MILQKSFLYTVLFAAQEIFIIILSMLKTVVLLTVKPDKLRILKTFEETYCLKTFE